MHMKKMMILLAALMMASSSLSAAQDRRSDAISAVRKAHKEAKEVCARSNDSSIPRNDLTITYHYMVPACGETCDTIRGWFELTQDEENWTNSYPIFFITRKYNIAARNFYEEYLFDRQSGKLLFVFLQGDVYTDDAGITVNEERYYYDERGLAAESIKGSRQQEDADIVRYAEALRQRLTLPDR